MTRDALIGYSGFVGTTLMKQARFSDLYRSSNIASIDGEQFQTVVCSAAPAQRWIANKEPEADRKNIDSLVAHLATVRCQTFLLISTVDVFADPNGVDEDAPVEKTGLHAYGLHRRLLEEFVEEHFAHRLIVRLSGLVGPGLRKNVIFDFQNNNNLAVVESRASYQFYPMVNLWYDIQTALRAGLSLVHLTAEPIRVDEVATLGFGRESFDNPVSATPAHYDFQSKYADLFHQAGRYQYSKNETLLAIRAYAQSEPLTIKT
jgi:dTDP-4-dehydrorhamnose reductase